MSLKVIFLLHACHLICDDDGACKMGTQEQTSVLRLRGLPYKARDSDVRHFLSGWQLLDVVLITEGAGPGVRSTGEAYAQFRSPDDAAEARQALHCHHLGNRYVECVPEIASCRRSC